MGRKTKNVEIRQAAIYALKELVSAAFKKAREDLGVNRSTVAKASGVSANAAYFYEIPDRCPLYLPSLYLMTTVLKVELRDLLPSNAEFIERAGLQQKSLIVLESGTQPGE